MLPFLLAGAAIAGVASLFSGDDDDDHHRHGPTEDDRRREHARNQRANIQNDIHAFTQDSVANIRTKYKASIEIDGETVNVVEKDQRLDHFIEQKKNDAEDLKMIIKQLRGEKNEFIR